MHPSFTYPSPSARYRLDILPEEAEQSHWIDSPLIYDNRTNKCILHLYRLWEASHVAWASEGEKVSMNLQHHTDSSATFIFEVDLEAKTASLTMVGYHVILSGTLDGVVGEMQHTTQLRTIFLLRILMTISGHALQTIQNMIHLILPKINRQFYAC